MLSTAKYVAQIVSGGNYSKEEAKAIVQALFELAQIAFDESNRE